MARKVVDLTIRLKDGVTGVLSKIRGGISRVGTAFKGLAKVGAVAFAGLGVAATALGATIKTAFKFETLRTQIKVLTGSVASAAKVFKELKEFSTSTPFELPGIVDAWTQLETFTNGALSARKGLELVGDAAAARGKDFATTAYWIGRLYSALKNGDPFMDAVGALQQMGMLGGTIRGDLTRLTEAGASFGDVWGIVTGQLSKFEGGMKDLSQTGGGLISTLRDNWTAAVATFGEAFMDSAKFGIQKMIDKLKTLVESGTITKWANQAKDALDSIIATVKLLSTSGDDRTKVMTAIANIFKAAIMDAAETSANILKAAAPAIGKFIADGFKGAMLSFGQGSADRAVAEERIAGRKGDAGFERSLPFTPAAKRNEEKIKAEMAKIALERAEALDISVADAIKGVGERTKKATAELNALLEKDKTQKSGPSRKGMYADMMKAVRTGARDGTGEGVEDGFKKNPTPSDIKNNLSGGINGQTPQGAAEFMKEMSRGQNGYSKKESISIMRELVKNGGAGQLEEAANVFKELTSGQGAMDPQEALRAVRELVKGGALTGDGTEVRDMIDQATRGQDGLSKRQAAHAAVGIYGGSFDGSPGADALGGAKVGTPTADPMTVANGYLKQIADNTKGGLL